MKRKHISQILLLTVAFMAFSLFGCRSSNNSVGKDSDTAVIETPAEETKSPEGQEEGSKDTSDFSDADEEIIQTPLEDIQGEGMPDDTVPDMSGIDSVPIGETCVISSEAGTDLCSLRINDIRFTTERNEEDTSAPESVAVIEYTYDNISSEEALLFDSMSFKLLQDEDVCTPYYLSTLTLAEPAEKGESSTGHLAFIVDKDSKDVKIYFAPESLDKPLVFTAELN